MFFIRTQGKAWGAAHARKAQWGPGMSVVDFMRLSRFAAPVLAAAVAWPLPAAAETPVHLKLDRKIDGPAAPFFVAIDKGYFKAEGLDVTIEAPAADPQEAAKQLATAHYDLATADLSLVIELRDLGVTAAKAVFVVFDKPPAAVIARRSRGLATPSDLAGKTLAAPANEPASARWPIFAKRNGIDPDKVMVEIVGQPVRDPMLASGEVDAITGRGFISYIDLIEHGVPKGDLVVWQMADYGVELYGATIVASETFMSEKPDAIRGFLRAYVKALKDTVRDPASAIESVLRRSDGAKKDIELERLRMAIADNIVTPAVRTGGFGAIDPARFAVALDQLALIYKFKSREKAGASFDPSFLPPANERSVSNTASR
jgi:NitT/TauT family transport system substrate-binding protein